MDVETENGITGYWLPVSGAYRCSVCLSKHKRVLRILGDTDEIRVCYDCGIAMRELLISALEDEEEGSESWQMNLQGD